VYVWSFKVLLCDNAEHLFTDIPHLFTAIHFRKNINSSVICIFVFLQ
jgi:hypothetical protein